MPETHQPTRTTRKDEGPGKGRAIDPRAADVGLDALDTEEHGEGVGFADERRSPATEHKTGRTDNGSAT
ncbi:MAG TPA: hypothetical protein VF188_05705 [Longimicrobiales bacterium]